MLEEATLMLIYSIFVVDVSSAHFLFINVVFLFLWLTFLVSVISVPTLSQTHSNAHTSTNLRECKHSLIFSRISNR